MNESSPKNLDHGQLEYKIDSAISQAPSLEEFQLSQAQEEEISKKLNRGEIDREQYVAEQKLIPTLLGSATFTTLPEFMQAIKTVGDKIGLSEKRQQDIVEHENDHHNRAESHGLPANYEIQFIKSEGRILIKPSVCFLIPKNRQREETSSICKDILSAPEELSPSDKAQLS